jgi:scavenger receptor class B, member 1
MMDESFKRSLNDTVVVPNVPLMAALKIASNLSFIESSGFDTILGISKPIEFQPKTVNEFLFGYSDQFIQLTPKIEPEKVGLLSGRNGISQDNMTIYTGEDTLDNLGRIDSMNGKPRLDIWNNEECNEIDGTDGSQFPPHLMDTSKDLKIFIRSFCRSLALRYEREVSVLNGIPAWRYKAPKGQFDSSRKNPDMKCYCDWEKENCLPDGIFDASKCNDGIPLLVSYPHFMEGDESLFKHFEGLKPDEKKHETFADIHPRMAFPIGGASRLQINMKVTNRKFGLLWDRKTLFKNFPENMILPIMWFEVTSGEIPPEFQSIVFHTTQSANATYIALKYGSLIGALVSIILLSLSAHWFACIKKDESDGQNGAEIVVIYNSNICPQLSSSIQS